MHLAIHSWSLAQDATTPFRCHLLERGLSLVDSHQAVQVTLVAPGGGNARPAPLPVAEVPGGVTAWDRLLFDQRRAPRRAAEIGADLLLNCEGYAALRSPIPLAVEAGRSEGLQQPGLLERIRRAIGGAGALGVFLRYDWADTSVEGGTSRSLVRLDPFVGEGFRPTDPGEDRRLRSDLGLPEAYVLCHGAEPVDLPFLLAAWTWVEGSVGEEVPLVFLGMTRAVAGSGRSRAAELGIGDSVRWLEMVDFSALPAVYRGAEVLLHPGHTRGGQELRWAMATGTPVAGVETADAASILGEAGYLIQAGQARALGAAALTLVVERRELAQDLREKGLLRARDFHRKERIEGYLQALQGVAARVGEGV